MRILVIVSYLVVLFIGFLIGVFLSISINNFFGGERMSFKLPLYTARINGATIFASPVLCRDDVDAEEVITKAVKDGHPEATVDDLHCCGYFDVFTGELEDLGHEETSVEVEE